MHLLETDVKYLKTRLKKILSPAFKTVDNVGKAKRNRMLSYIFDESKPYFFNELQLDITL